MTHSRRLYQFLRRPLKKLERQVKVAETAQTKPLENHAVLIGCHRAGGIILHGLKPIFGEDVVVLDFNPDVVEELNSKAINCVYGDAADLEVLESLNLIKADLVVSTVRDLKDNLAVLDYLEKIQSRAVIILTAEDLAQAAKLYERGAHYVSLPTDLEGASITRIIHEHAADRKWFLLEREKKLGEVKSRLYA
jgi:Trk K+ transport system NAD-binding subunit